MNVKIIKSTSETETEAERQAHNERAIKEAFAAARKRGVIKAASNTVREYDIDELYRPQGVEDSTHADTESARLAQRLESFAGQVEDVTTRPVWATDPFLHGDANPDDGAPRPLGYAVVEDPGIAAPSTTFPKAGSGMNDVVATPANFDAPKPQPRRLGSGYVMKRGMFTSVIFGAEPVTKVEGDPSLADIFGLAK